MEDQKQKQREYLSMAITAVLAIALTVSLFFIMVWHAPDPPLPVYGLELSLGTSERGSGEPVKPIKAATPVETPPTKITPKPIPQPEEQPEEVEEVTPEESTPTEETITPEVIETQEEPSYKEEEKKEKVVKPKEEPKEEVKPIHEFPSKQKAAEEQTQTAPQPSSGTDESGAGNQGKEEGKIDERGIYQGSFGAKGASLDMKGWAWDGAPRPQDTSNESGKIVYQIRIDEDGEIQEVRRIESTVRPEIETKYRKAVEQLTFSRTADNLRPTPFTTGRITFIINAN
ncbi:hypothetical protein [Persicobacter psychrovividus]|uniref:Energy transducer TonB n=1 Tax=Persicobacter psychrovividus TaxID=387638 RepID=A0ABN6L777_9BACT|nr:hypothetical protein PEPS_12490 [Persicobacter psychrovividus]